MRLKLIFINGVLKFFLNKNKMRIIFANQSWKYYFYDKIELKIFS